MEQALKQMSLAQLANRCQEEMKRRRRREVFDDRYCLEIFHRAIVGGVDQAWSMLQRHFDDTVRIWLRSHPSCDVALLRDSEENYVSQTFSRFWYAVRNQRVEFATLNAALSYLHATLNGLITDTLRSHLRAREVSSSELEPHEEPFAEDHGDDQTTWEMIQSLLADERERRVAFLLYYCGLKPREILSRCPGEFSDVKEIYRLNVNIVERLRRNKDRLRWLLSDEER
jgi:DNA-directed RNA polymerase specialized sigma24 family protein